MELFSDLKDEKRDGLRWSDVDFEERSIEIYGKSRDYETAPFPESVHDVLERWRGLLDPPTDEWPVFPTGHYQSKREALVESIGEETVSAALEDRGDAGKTEVLNRLHCEHEVPPPSISKEGVRRLMKRLTKEAGIEPDGDESPAAPVARRRRSSRHGAGEDFDRRYFLIVDNTISLFRTMDETETPDLVTTDAS